MLLAIALNVNGRFRCVGRVSRIAPFINFFHKQETFRTSKRIKPAPSLEHAFTFRKMV